MQPILVHLGNTIVPGRILVQEGSITGPGVLVTFTPGQPGVLVNTDGVGPGVYVEFDNLGPATPDDIVAIGGNNVVSLYWTASVGATSYDLQSSPDNSTWTTISAAQPGLFYVDSSPTTGAFASGLTYYRVRATDGSGSSSYTAGVSTSPWQMYDATTAANGTHITAHTPSINQPGGSYTNPTASGLNGLAVIQSNRITGSGSAGAGGWIWAYDFKNADKTITALCTAESGGQCGIVTRLLDGSNFFMANIEEDTQEFNLYECNGNTFTKKDSQPFTVVAGTQYQITLTVQGNVLTASVVGGSGTLTYTISGSFAGSLTSTLVGGRPGTVGATITNVGVAMATPIPGLLTRLTGRAGFTVSTWTDQSFHGNDATQSTPAQQLSLVTNQLGGQAIVRSPDVNRIMNLPAIQPTNAAFAKALLFKCSDLTQTNNMLAGPFGNQSHILNLNASQFPTSIVVVSSAENVEIVSSVGVGSPQTNWALAILAVHDMAGYNGSPETLQQSLFVNGQCAGVSQILPQDLVTLNSVSVAGLAGFTTFGSVVDYAEVIISQPPACGLTADDANRLAAEINSLYGLTTPLFTQQVLLVGDSITAGAAGSVAGGCFAYLLAKAMPSRFWVNKGRPGAASTDVLNDIGTQLYPFAQCSTKTAAVVLIGTNDIAINGASGATTYSNAKTICTDLRARGVSPIIGVTMLPRDIVETERQKLNNAWRADHSFVDALADVETLPMGAAGANDSLTYFNADKVHPNDAGHAALYTLISAALVSAGW